MAKNEKEAKKEAPKETKDPALGVWVFGEYTVMANSKEEATQNIWALIKSADAKQYVLMIDVELCSRKFGTILWVGCVFACYMLNNKKWTALDAQEWCIKRDKKEYDEDGEKFWNSEGAPAKKILEAKKDLLTSEQAARAFHAYYIDLWRLYPALNVLFDSPTNDFARLELWLLKHGLDGLQYVHNEYKKSFYVTRDLMRGAISVYEMRFKDLHMRDLYKTICELWAKTQPKPLNSKPKDLLFQEEFSHFPLAKANLRLKHVPIWDAFENLVLYLKTCDLDHQLGRH